MVTIGKILKPFGVRGEVRVQSLSDVPNRYERLGPVKLACPDGTSVTTTVESARAVKHGYILRCAAFSTPEAAARYQGALIQIEKEPDLPHAPDTYYQFEVIGLDVEDGQGQPMGTVTDILDLPHQQIFVITQDEREWLVPARKEMVDTIDLTKNLLRLRGRHLWDQSNAL